MVDVKVKKLVSNAIIPAYKSDQAAGFDLSSIESVVVAPGEFRMIKTGLAMEIPPGFEGMVRPRSGLAAKHGISIVNTPGTVDSDYRGEIMILLINHGQRGFQVNAGDRIGQMVINEIPIVRLIEVETLNETARGEGGLGSTGVK